MIDDERLQELLTRASSLYNNGDYKAAIEAWQEALGVDPASQKAREGIRMATLLLGDWDPAATTPAAAPEAPADGASATPEDLGAEEAEARLEVGLARVKQLLAGRHFAEALEGAKGLQSLAPDAEEVQRLIEEAQQAFEAAPFVEEHLTLSRELLSQERYAEAEEEVGKVFVLDSGHPGAKALQGEIRQKARHTLQRAADQMGGMTVKLNTGDLQASRGQEPAATTPGRRGAAAAPAEAPGEERILEAGDEPSIALGEPAGGGRPEDAGATAAAEAEELFQSAAGEHGEAARSQEEVASRSLLEEAFQQAGVGPEPGAAAPAPETEEVEATTVVPPSVRMVPKAAPAPPQAPPAKAPATARSRPAVTQAQMKGGPPPGEAPAVPAADAASIPGFEFKGSEEVSAWEKELTQLNIKAGEHPFMAGTGAGPAGAPREGAEADLMSILDTDLGAPGAAPGPVPDVQGIPLAGPAAAAPPHVMGKERVRKHPADRPAPKRAPEAAPIAAEEAAPRERVRERPRAAAAVSRRRPALGRWLILLVVLGGAGAGAWHFYLKDGATGLPGIDRLRTLAARYVPGLGGPGSPAQPTMPPEGAPAPAADPSQGVIPTPIGSPGRPPGPEDPAPVPAAAAAGPVPAPADPGTGAEKPAAALIAPPAVPKGPIKPEGPPSLPPEVLQRRVAGFMTDGRRLMGLGKWREARAKLSAALALDPANFQIKEMLDQTQSRLDEEQRLLDDFESTRQFFKDKDYENALRKLYRLPRDKGLGDIDVYIRNAWYNWAVVSMKAGNATDALKKLDELLQVDPDDAEALRVQEVAEHYVARAKDRVFYAFVDKLRLRAIEQK